MDDALGPSQWTDPRWLASIGDWATTQLEAAGRIVSGPIEQSHVRPWSTVLRIPTDGGPVWAKAAGPGTAHEVRLLPAMAAWSIPHVLTPLAVHADRGWLLLPDGGPTLRQTRPDATGDKDLRAWEGILVAYADLQRSLEGRADALLELGVPDGRPDVLSATLSGLVRMDQWWDLVGPDDRATAGQARSRLGELAGRVAVEAGELATSGIPSTLQHDDLHGGNVFVGREGIRFFDWGDSVVAHPFASMVTTLNSIADRFDTDTDGPQFQRLRDAYLDAWTDVLPRSSLQTVLERALSLGRIGKAAAWARALGGVDPAEMEGHGDAPALWLADLVERLERRTAG